MPCLLVDTSSKSGYIAPYIHSLFSQYSSTKFHSYETALVTRRRLVVRRFTVEGVVGS